MKVLVIGAGKLGMRLAKTLSDEEIDITVLDNDPQVIQKVKNDLDVLTVEGNALDFDLLQEIGIGTYDLAIGAVSSDESNVLLCSIVKKMGCKASIARVRDTQYHNQISFISKELDIDYVINPDMATATTIEKYLLKKYSLVVDEFAGGQVKTVEFNIGREEHFVGKKIREISYLKNLLISAISREGETLIPNGETVLEENDIILLTGAPEAVDEFDRSHSHVAAVLPVKKVLILGAGKLGHYLTKFLLKDDIDVTVVEQNREKAQVLKENFPEAMVLHGDGTDFNFLQDEMVNSQSYDAFVAATGIDETNLLMALAMRQEGIHKVVAKISRPHFNWMLERLGLDAIFSPNLITASVILKIIRGKDALSITPILDGQGEIIEITMSPSLDILGTPLKDLKLPNNMILASILRGDQVEIPDGSSYLKAGDRVIIFCLHRNIGEIQRFFKLIRKKKGWFHELRG
ncbi:MAG: Trk system potassium transporter TrkA [Tissierellia bacterium]|nr:Trk system potassium transporter TrkA [Tissierellia bacterium]